MPGPTLESATQQRAADTRITVLSLLKTAGHHLANWQELYGWVPLALLAIIGAAEFEYLLTGRRPEEGVGWIGDYASRATACVLVIVFCSLYRQAQQTFDPKETDTTAGIIARCVKNSLALLVFAYILLH